MFTLEQIEEIHRKLQLFGVKDMDLPTLTEQLDGSEVLTLIKNGRNIQLMVSQFLNFDMFTPEQLESLRGPQGLEGKNAYQTWLAQGNVGTYDDYLTILQLPALTASETLTITINNKLDEADDVIIRLNNKNEEMQQVISEAIIAKDLAQEVVTHPPAIINGYWHLWNHVTNQYDTTYVKAAGDTAYEIWLAEGNTGTLEDYFAYLQSPANEAIASIQEVENIALYNETLRETAEALRVTAETTRVQNEQGRVTAENTREQNETTRVNAEDDRNAAEGLRLSAETTREQNEQARETAEGLRVTAEQTRQTNTATAIQNATDAATNANTKAGLADTAATNADNARLAIQGDLALKENTSNKQNSLTTDGTGTKFPTVDAVNANIVPYIPAMQGLQTVASKNQFYPVIENNAGAIVGKHQTASWNGSSWVADNSFGMGNSVLANNMGTGVNGVGANSLQNNTGAQSNGMGNNALQNNTGAASNGVGGYALYYNTGAASNGVGQSALYNNTGAQSNGVGANSLYYNQKANNSAFGHGAYSAFLDNTAGNKSADSTAVDITLERITITAHGFGATNEIVNIKYASTTGTAIGGLGVGTVYQVKIIDANTIEFVTGTTKRNLTSQGTGTHTFTPQFSYGNTTCLGANTQPNKDNQVVLGSTAVDTVKMGGTARTIASPTETGVKGEWCWDANYIYVCVATNTWKRTALTTW